ncbi:MAG: helix-turn-helix transcriptional regulator [Bdellovibrionales bacterium]
MSPIYQLRAQLGMTQQELAEMAGTSQPTIAAYEAGRKSPTLETLQKLANSASLEISISFVPALTREDLRSLAYHRAIAKKLKADPQMILAKARRNLARMRLQNPSAKKLFSLWRNWLDLPLENLIASLTDPSLMGRDMRQVTPFAGVLTAQERSKVLQTFQKQESP